jgi:hypothetical protein
MLLTGPAGKPWMSANMAKSVAWRRRGHGRVLHAWRACAGRGVWLLRLNRSALLAPGRSPIGGRGRTARSRVGVRLALADGCLLRWTRRPFCGYVVSPRRLVSELANANAAYDECDAGGLDDCRTCSVGLMITRCAGRLGSANRAVSNSTAARPIERRGGRTALSAGLKRLATSSS